MCKLVFLQFDFGNGNSTCEESDTHFTIWALMKSLLLIGTDVRMRSRECMFRF
ncbi:hypothetical protein EDD15DRAFT_2246320, partial [Pisolithus albus]